MTDVSKALAALGKLYDDAIEPHAPSTDVNANFETVAQCIQQQVKRIAELEQSCAPGGWRHVANEWADMATSGLQWLRNIDAGTSTVDQAILNMDDLLVHCKSVSDAQCIEQQKRIAELGSAVQAECKPAYWAAVDADGNVAATWSTDDGNDGQAARQECNDWINTGIADDGMVHHLVPLYRHSAHNVHVQWVVDQWHAQVSKRPMVNVHRRTLDNVWRQVIRQLGHDDVALLGPRHDDLTDERGTITRDDYAGVIAWVDHREVQLLIPREAFMDGDGALQDAMKRAHHALIESQEVANDA